MDIAGRGVHGTNHNRVAAARLVDCTRTIFDKPQYTLSFFTSVSVSMLANDLLTRRNRHAGLALAFPICLAFVAGALMLCAHCLVGPGVMCVALGCIGALLMGFGTACAQLSSARFLARLDAQACTATVITALSFSALSLTIAVSNRSLAVGTLFALFPLIAYACMRKGSRLVPEDAFASPGSEIIEVLGPVEPDGVARAGTVAGCAVATGAFVVFAARFELYLLGEPTDAAGPLPCALFALILCALVLVVMSAACLKTRTLSMTFLYRLSLPLVIAAALLVALVPATFSSAPPYWVAAFCASTAMLFIDQMVWITTAYFMRFDASFSETTASRFRMLQYAGAAIGALFSLPSVLSFGVTQTMLVCTALLGCAFIVCIPTYEARVVSAGAQAPRLGGIDAGMRNRHAAAFARYGLTTREAEVVCLMLQGLDAPGIARELVVSRATVNTHVRHVYEKTGVHCREELAALLGEAPR